jgi:hypothetical protein
LIQFTPDVRLLWAPAATYRQINSAAAAPLQPSRWSLAARASVAPAIAGVTTGLSATGRVSWSLVLSGIVCWSFLAAIQSLTAAMLIGRQGRPIGYWRAFELFFLGHAAWSLWLIAAAAYLLAAPELVRREDLLISTAIVPLSWTAVLIFAYCREILRLEVRRAVLRTAVHQGLTILVIVAYVAWAIQLWPRLLAPTLR